MVAIHTVRPAEMFWAECFPDELMDELWRLTESRWEPWLDEQFNASEHCLNATVGHGSPTHSLCVPFFFEDFPEVASRWDLRHWHVLSTFIPRLADELRDEVGDVAVVVLRPVVDIRYVNTNWEVRVTLPYRFA